MMAYMIVIIITFIFVAMTMVANFGLIMMFLLQKAGFALPLRRVDELLLCRMSSIVLMNCRNGLVLILLLIILWRFLFLILIFLLPLLPAFKLRI